MKFLPLLLPLILFLSCSPQVSADRKAELADNSGTTVQTAIGPLTLPSPYTTPSKVKQSKVIGWPTGAAPAAPAGFEVTRFAENLEHPRMTYVAPNGEVFVVESNTRNSANRISRLRNGERSTIADELHQPFGMLIKDDYFYVADTDTTWRYPYEIGQPKLVRSEREFVAATPPQGYNNHWTRNLLDGGGKIYLSVGSGSNVGENGMENEVNRATILEMNPDGSGLREFATGLRNPVGMDWNPITGELWTAVNERDKLGDNLVPDYLTSVKEGAFYGWPYSYFGQIPDPRWESDPHTELVRTALVPDVPLGPHTASLGLAFYKARQFPERYRNGAFIGQHGSWNRSVLSGYKVVFVPFDKQGRPGQPEDFLTGFLADADKGTAYGRPAMVTLARDGSLLVADDAGGVVWRVAAVRGK